MTSIDIISLNRQLIQLIKHPNVGSKRRPGQAVKILKKLRDTRMTIEYLWISKIGWTVNFLRSSNWSEEVVQLADELVNNWSKLVPDTKKVKNTKIKRGKQKQTRKKKTTMYFKGLIDEIVFKHKNIESVAKEVSKIPTKKVLKLQSKKSIKLKSINKDIVAKKIIRKKRKIISDDSDAEIEVVDKENRAPKKSVRISPNVVSKKPRVAQNSSTSNTVRPLKPILKNTPRVPYRISGQEKRKQSVATRRQQVFNNLQTEPSKKRSFKKRYQTAKIALPQSRLQQL